MASPAFVAAYSGSNPPGTLTTQTVSVTCAAGDTLVAYGATDGRLVTLGTPTGGTGITWTLQSSVVGVTSHANCYMWSAQPATGQTFTFSLTESGGSGDDWSFFVLRFSGSSGLGAVANTNSTTSGAPTLNITTTQADSVIVVGNVDFVPVNGASRTWLTNAGAFTEEYYGLSANMGMYGGFHADSGAVNTYAVGLSAPTGQVYSLVAVEVLPVPVAAAQPIRLPFRAAIQRASSF